VSAVLLDTSVASLLHPRRRASTLLALYEADLRGKTLAVDLQTVAELWSWADENGWGSEQRAGLRRFVSHFVVLPHTMEVAERWAQVMVGARRRGRRLEAGDAWIAAAAVAYTIPLVTHDQDFVGLEIDGLRVVCRAG